MDAFDADALIYAAVGDPRGATVREHIETNGGVGSVVLVPEVLSKPLALGNTDQLRRLKAMLGHLHLFETDTATADLAATLGASYRLRAADAIHLATAVAAGADRFVTNNARDFGQAIAEIEVVRPDQL